MLCASIMLIIFFNVDVMVFSKKEYYAKYKI